MAYEDSPTIMESLQEAHPRADQSVIRRLIRILEICTSDEVTIEELCEKFDMHYQTIYANVKTLVGLGLLEVSERRVGRKNLYRARWDAIPETERGIELRWRSGGGDFSPISEYIDKFLGVGPRRLAYEVEMFGKCLVANHVNKRLADEGEIGYGKSHEEALFVRMNSTIEFLENMLEVMRQAVESPIIHQEYGWQMYKLPENALEKSIEIHDELETYFQQEGYYEDSYYSRTVRPERSAKLNDNRESASE